MRNSVVRIRVIISDLAPTAGARTAYIYYIRKAKYKTELRADGQTDVQTYRAQECPVR